MKKIFSIIALLSIYLNIYCQENLIKNENGIYEVSEIKELHNITKEEIFNKTIQFLTIKYKFSQVSIQYQNLNDGKIIAKGEWLTEPSKWNGYIGHTFEMDIKDNKYRIKIYNLTFRYFNNFYKKAEDITYPFETMPNFMGMRKNIFNDAENTLSKYKIELEKYIISSTKDNW